MEKRLRDYYLEIDPISLIPAFEKKVSQIDPTTEFVRNLILDLRIILRVLIDKDFNLSEEAKRDFISAVNYFIKTKDSIPDWIPLIGLLDDRRVVSYVKNKHKKELERYFKEVKFFIANNL
ncbi:MAG: YkvA family protein [Aquificaceae bacterium]|nr:YkvA family protein [Aquificaceae bacterium]MDW8237072.1 YkvA family protein [Aquificaceae bacterium]